MTMPTEEQRRWLEISPYLDEGLDLDDEPLLCRARVWPDSN
jgi:hypothetical protein